MARLKGAAFAYLALVSLAGLLVISCSELTDPAGAAQPVIIGIKPANKTWNVGSFPNFTLEVDAFSPDGSVLSYQWYSKANTNAAGVIMSGETEKQLTLDRRDYASSSSYYFYVMVTNIIPGGGGKGHGKVSETAVVTVTGVAPVDAGNPVITRQPTGGFWNIWLPNDHAKNNAKLTVAAASPDSETLSYQWYINSANSESGSTALTGKTSAALTLTPVEFTAYDNIPNGTNYFYVVVTNTIADNGDGGVKTAAARSNIVRVSLDGIANGIIGYWWPGNFGGPNLMDDYIITPEFYMIAKGMPGWGNIGLYQGYIQYISFFSRTFGIIIVKYDEGHENGWYNPSDNSGDYYGIYIERYEPGISWGITNTSDCDNGHISSETKTLEEAIERFDENGAGRWFVIDLTPDYYRYNEYTFD